MSVSVGQESGHGLVRASASGLSQDAVKVLLGCRHLKAHLGMDLSLSALTQLLTGYSPSWVVRLRALVLHRLLTCGFHVILVSSGEA